MLVFALVACSDDKKPHDLPFEVRFVCPEDGERADRLTLRVMHEGCEGREVLDEQMLVKGDKAEAFNGVAAGDYGLEVTALSEGTVIASDCVDLSLPLAGDAERPAILLRGAECDVVLEPELDASAEPADPIMTSMDGARAETGSAACSSDCSDPFPCTEDRCVNGECLHEPFSGPRECDGLACTRGDRCELGTCQAGEPDNAACPDDGNPCTAETCELEIGCNRDNAEGAPCNDQIQCTGQDACRAGICRGTDGCGSGGGVCSAATGMCTACSGSADCDDRDPCTNDSCEGGTCKHANNTAACSDGKSCTANDKCNNRVCAGTSTCPSDASCGGSACRCNDTTKSLCSNTCVALASSNQHCGQCGRVCNNATCQNSACKPNAASNCTAWRFGGHDYLLCSESLNWPQARDRCRSYGFGLVIIDSQAEKDFLRARPNAAARWMGAHDRGENGENCRRNDSRDATRGEGFWFWADPTNSSNEYFRPMCAFASTSATSCSTVNSAYLNWNGSEPNNEGCDSCGIGDCSDGEDCGVFNADGTWSDSSCGNTLGFICETP
jgi:hypothetical protein